MVLCVLCRPVYVPWRPGGDQVPIETPATGDQLAKFPDVDAEPSFVWWSRFFQRQHLRKVKGIHLTHRL